MIGTVIPADFGQMGITTGGVRVKTGKMYDKFRGQSKIAENVGISKASGDFTLTPPIYTSHGFYSDPANLREQL